MRFAATTVMLLVLSPMVWMAAPLAGVAGEPPEEPSQTLHRRLPGADLERDGTPVREERLKSRRRMRPAGAPAPARPSAPAGFDVAAYLAALSAEGKERGYKEFAYKQTPQGELRIYFAMPAGWSPRDRRPVMIFFYGGGWSGGRVFACAREAEHFARRGVLWHRPLYDGKYRRASVAVEGEK